MLRDPKPGGACLACVSCLVKDQQGLGSTGGGGVGGPASEGKNVGQLCAPCRSVGNDAPNAGAGADDDDDDDEGAGVHASWGRRGADCLLQVKDV